MEVGKGWKGQGKGDGGASLILGDGFMVSRLGRASSAETKENTMFSLLEDEEDVETSSEEEER